MKRRIITIFYWTSVAAWGACCFTHNPLIMLIGWIVMTALNVAKKRVKE